MLIKVGLFAGLLGAGWANRTRVLPGLRAAAAGATAPGHAGRLLRRSLRVELAIAVVVLGVTCSASRARCRPTRPPRTPARGIDDLRVDVSPSGPGHYTSPSAVFGVRGGWTLTVTARVSDFDQYDAKVPVRIR